MKGKRNHIIILLALIAVTIMLTTVSVSAAGNAGMKKDFKSVTVTPMHNGYCSLSFSVPGTTKEVFVTGIRKDKAEEIYNKFMDAWKDGQAFSITDESIIDAEKTPDSDDSELCFAATGINMMVYAGWAAQLDPSLKFISEDDIFEEIIPEFTNTPDNPAFLPFDTLGFLEWFFSGTQSSEIGGEIFVERCLRNYPDSGGYLTDYDISSLGERDEFIGVGYPLKLKKILTALKDGTAVGVGNAGHAVTCFGVVIDTSYPDTDEKHYPALILADSDNDKDVTGTDRRTLPNKLSVTPITNRKLFGSSLEYLYFLKPYDGQVGIESDPEATKDRLHDPDLRIQGMNVATEPGPALPDGYIISKGEDCILNIGIQEYSDVGFTGTLSIQATIYHDDEKVAEKEISDTVSLIKYEDSTYPLDFSSENLPAGDYRAVATISAAAPAREAFLCNNTSELSFTVSEKKVSGPASSTIDAEIENYLTEHSAIATLIYNEADLDFLKKSESATVFVAHYNEDEDDVFKYTKRYRTDNDGLPKTVNIDKEKESTRICVAVSSGGRVFYLYSPVYRIPYALITASLDEDTTQDFSPIPYKGTQFNGDEKISFSIEYETIAYDKPFSGNYFLTRELYPADLISDSVPFTLKPGETKESITITGWNTPLTKDTTVYLAWREEDGFYNYRNAVPIGTIKVLKPEYYTAQLKPGDGTGQMNDITAAPGGQFELPDCTFTAPEGRAFYKWKAETGYPVHVAAGESYPAESDQVFKARYLDPRLAGHSVDVDEEAVRVNFYLNLSDEEISDEIAVHFQWGDKEETLSVTPDNYDAERGAYLVTCPLGWDNKNEQISAEIYRNDSLIAVRTYSIEKYYNDITANYSEYEINDYNGDALYRIFASYPRILTASGFENTAGAEDFPFLPSWYDTEDAGAADFPYPDESQAEFEAAVHAEGYSGIYDGKAYGITVTVPEGAKVRYGTEEGNYGLEDNPKYTNAGTYRVYYEVSKEGLVPVTGSETVSIEKADPTVTAPLAKDLTYNGKTQELVSAGEAQGGEILYVLGKDADTAPAEESFSKTIPAGTNAGTYYVWFRAVGDENHKSADPRCVPVILKPKDISKAVVTLDKSELTYNGKDQVVSVKSVVLDGTDLPADAYKLAGELSGFEVRKYTLKVEGVGNYTGSVSAEWSITPAPTGSVTTTPTTKPKGTETPKPTGKPATTTPTVTASPTATTKPTPIPFTPRPQRTPVTTASPTPTVTPSPKADAKAGDSKSGSGGGSGSGTSPGKATAGGSVATGDETNAEIWLIMMAGCVVVLMALRGKESRSARDDRRQ